MATTQMREVGFDRYVSAAATGDREAFAHLIDATRTLVSSIAFAIVGDLDLSRDIAQDVFLTAWRDLGKLRNPVSFLPWLRQLTRRRAHEVARHRRWQRRHVVTEAAHVRLEAVVDPRPNVVERLMEHDELRLVIATLERLPPEAREVITLYYRQGQSTRHVAELLELSVDAVKQRLSRARSRLRDSVLARAGTALEQTAPDPAFTAAVIVALGPAAPAACAAASVGLSKWFGGSSAATKALAACCGALLGGSAGVGAVVIGGRLVQRNALDERERRELRRLTTLPHCLCRTLGNSVTPAPELLHCDPVAGRWLADLHLKLGTRPHIVHPAVFLEQGESQHRRFVEGFGGHFHAVADAGNAGKTKVQVRTGTVWEPIRNDLARRIKSECLPGGD